MKAEDLMLGDLLTFGECVNDKEFPVIKVTGILEDTLFAQIDGDTGNDELDYEDLVGIPLTPEILEKNGFVNDNSVYGVRYRWESDDTRTEVRIYSPQLGYAGMTIIKNSYLVDEVSYDLPDVYTVHELQHCLKLCKIEKEIIV